MHGNFEHVRAPGRPRSEATRQAILKSAINLLKTEPFDRISIERIALNGRVGKQSIYRWWDSKADVLLEAIADQTQVELARSELTGSAITDLRALLRQLLSALHDPTVAKTLRGLIAEAQIDDEFRRKFHEAFVAPRNKVIRDVLERGLASGEFRANLDLDITLDVIHGAWWYRLLSGSTPFLDAAYMDSIVDMIGPAFEPSTLPDAA